jgi:hypothetical protein
MINGFIKIEDDRAKQQRKSFTNYDSLFFGAVIFIHLFS